MIAARSRPKQAGSAIQHIESEKPIRQGGIRDSVPGETPFYEQDEVGSRVRRIAASRTANQAQRGWN